MVKANSHSRKVIPYIAIATTIHAYYIAIVLSDNVDIPIISYEPINLKQCLTEVYRKQLLIGQACS